MLDAVPSSRRIKRLIDLRRYYARSVDEQRAVIERLRIGCDCLDRARQRLDDLQTSLAWVREQIGPGRGFGKSAKTPPLPLRSATIGPSPGNVSDCERPGPSDER